MADVAPEVKETVPVVEKEVEKPEVEEVKEVKKAEEPVEESDKSEKCEKPEKNGNAEESKPENGVEDKCALKNGNVKQNGFADEKESESETKESADSNEVCGIKRKSVGLEGAEAEVESSEKKQKLEGSAEPDVAANGDAVEAKA